jgi:signal transduction histidine kinase
VARFPLRPSRLGLRNRLAFTFALNALLLSAFLAGVTLALTRANLISQRESAATRTAVLNARYIKQGIPTDLGTADPAAADVQVTLRSRLGSVAQPTGLTPILRIVIRGKETWISNQTEVGESSIPQALRDQVISQGTPGRMTYHDDKGRPELAIGIPLRVQGTSASYFEIVSFSELQSALNALTLSLLGAAALTTFTGAAIGYLVSRRALRPLSEVSLAAEAIAGGQLDTRLGETDDPDLGALVTSFNDMVEALEGRIERDGRFASDVSHELRSPLMTLSASIEVLASRREEMPDESAQSAVDLMVADVARFKQLVEDLLEISRFDAGAARLELDEVRLAELVMQSVSWSTSRDVPVELDSDLAGVIVRADKRRIVRVVANLLDNAEKYGGGATGVSLRKVEHGVQLAVEDAGPGVPADERDLVFDRFSRGLGASRRGSGSDGMGLGLSLVAEHVRLHGGQVWVEDRLDGEPGARFVFELPVNWADQEIHEEVLE